MPMPVDVKVSYNDGSSEEVYIPLQMMRWEKPGFEEEQTKEDWAWAYPTYSFILSKPKSEVTSIEIDSSGMMADTKRENNVYPAPQE